MVLAGMTLGGMVLGGDEVIKVEPSEWDKCPSKEAGCFPGGSEVKASAWKEGDLGSIPELGRSPGEGNGNPLQYSCLENPMEGGTW